MSYKLNGRSVTREEFLAGSKPFDISDFKQHHAESTWPMHSEAMAVHPSQRIEAMKAAEAKGVPTEFDSQGRAVFKSAIHRKQYCESYGVYDRSGGYSDPRKMK